MEKQCRKTCGYCKSSSDEKPKPGKDQPPKKPNKGQPPKKPTKPSKQTPKKPNQQPKQNPKKQSANGG
jgi:hypothetical protein